MKPRKFAGNLHKENPFLNQLIVAHVLHVGNWSSADLKSLRLVCKLWHDVSFDLWRSCGTISLYQRRDTRLQHKLPGLSVSQFLTRIPDPHDPYKLSSKPFSHYRLVNWRIRMKRDETETREESEVFEKLAVVSKHIHLDHCTFEGTAFHEVVFERLPKLEELKLTKNRMNWQLFSCGNWQYVNRALLETTQQAEKLTSLEISGIVPFPWDNDRLLPKCPNLKIVKIGDRNGFTALTKDWPRVREFIPQNRFPFMDMSVPPAIPQITSLDLTNTDAFTVTKEDIDDLKTWKLQLNSLAVWLSPSGTRAEDLESLLQIYKDTLKVLTILIPPIAPPLEKLHFNFEMNNMTELYLWGNMFGSFQFLKCMPSLKVLYLNFSCFEKRNEPKFHKHRISKICKVNANELVDKVEEGDIINHIELCELKHLHVDLEFSGESMKKLKRWMPRITKLETVVTSQTLPIISREWPHLTELNLLFGSEVDNVGISSVAKLSDLTRFKLLTRCDRGSLTERSMKSVFLNSPRLNTLCASVSSEFSARAEETLKSKICQVYLIRSHRTSDATRFECCDRANYFEDKKKSRAAVDALIFPYKRTRNT